MSHYDEERETTRCTRNMNAEQAKEWPTEERINTIGQNGNTGAHYMNNYSRKLREETGSIDVYDVLDAFRIENPALAHAIKKLLAAGDRGVKSWEQDLQEAIDSLERAKSFPPLPF